MFWSPLRVILTFALRLAAKMTQRWVRNMFMSAIINYVFKQS